jgi:hypothetical protein
VRADDVEAQREGLARPDPMATLVGAERAADAGIRLI